VTSYATPTDLTTLSVSAGALTGFTNADIQASIDVASQICDGYLNDQFTLPLTTWGMDLRIHVCNMAVYLLLSRRGFNPTSTDTTIRDRYDDALSWLTDVARGRINPQGLGDSTPGVREGSPAVLTGLVGNTVGGTVTPTQTLGRPAAYPYTSTLPGRRGW
jgi:phage gp36-like protein